MATIGAYLGQWRCRGQDVLAVSRFSFSTARAITLAFSARGTEIAPEVVIAAGMPV